MSILLDKANQTIQQTVSVVNKQYYPYFHLAPPVGWMNDPNGLIYFNGQYHAFYQYHPYDANWGPMHWGHAVSDDLVYWRHLPVALAPDQDFDSGGCFSGSAVIDNGELCLIYTGHVYVDQQHHPELIRETQCLATSKDGIHFEKHGTILSPEEGIMHFRDPKVWKLNGQWWMVVGRRNLQDVGQIVIYRSSDLHSWHFEQVLIEHIDENVYMLECPDFFPLGDKWILMCSPQGFKPQQYQYRNLFQSGYIVGTWQPGQPFKVEKDFTELDYGHDFYAPQTFISADGRRLMFGWMDMWQSKMPSQKDHWSGCFTLPRELVLDNHNQLLNRPVKELTVLRQTATKLQDLQIVDEGKHSDLDCTRCEIDITFDMTVSNAERFGLQLAATKEGKQATLLYVDMQSERIVLDRSLSGQQVTGYRSVPLPKTNLLHMRIYVDASSIEVFVEQGLYSLSSRIYPLLPAERQLNFFAENGAMKISQFTHWQLNSIYKG